MFGHQDDQPVQQDSSDVPDELIHEGQASATSPPPPAIVEPDVTPAPDPAPASSDPAPAATDSQAWQHPGTPLDTSQSQEPIKDIISPAGGFPKKPTYQYPVPSISSSDTFVPKTDAGNPATEELVEIKKKAVDDLTPIIDKLDLPPDEKFRTIMMMIQSTDNQDLVKSAYTAAHSIEDEKERAQALLDIINEVNYFTNPHDDLPPQEAN